MLPGGAFIALGGNPDDKKSFIASARLKQLIKEEFALTFDIDVRAILVDTYAYACALHELCFT
jgi:hypothetical protein